MEGLRVVHHFDFISYNSSAFYFDPTTRHVVAQAHMWKFDFVFSRDYASIDRGTYSNTSTGEVWYFGTAPTQLLFQKVIDGMFYYDYVLVA